MKYRILFILLGLCSISNMYSQKDLKPGYIITLQNDTIFGQINNQSTSSFNSKCEFIPNNSTESTTYLPGEIQSFRSIDDKCFISKTVNLHGDDKEMFLEFLLEGIVNLYFCHYKKEETYYIEKDGLIYTLEKKQVDIVGEDNLQYRTEIDKYKAVLALLFQDEPQLSKEINSTMLTHKSLIKVTEDYHNIVCDDHQCIIYEKKRKKMVARPFVGYRFSTVTLKTSPDKYQYSSFIAGIDCNLPTFIANPRWNYSVGLYVSKDEVNNVFKNTLYLNNAEANERTHRIKVKAIALEIPLGIEYTVPVKKLMPYVGFGYSNVFLLDREAEVSRLQAVEYNIPSESHIRLYQAGLNASAGFKMPVNSSYIQVRFNYQYRFNPLQDNYKTDYLRTQSYSINLAWAFNGNQK